MQNAADRLFRDLKDERDSAWVEPWYRVHEVLQLVGGLNAARAAQDRGEELLDEEPWPPSDVLPAPLQDAFLRWRRAGEMPIPPPPSDLLPIPKARAEVWDAARRRFTEDGDVDALLQLSALRAYREVHGAADRTRRQHISPMRTPE